MTSARHTFCSLSLSLYISVQICCLKLIIFSVLSGVIIVQCLILRVFLWLQRPAESSCLQVILTGSSWKLETQGKSWRAPGKRWLHRSAFTLQSFQKQSCISQPSAAAQWLKHTQTERSGAAYSEHVRRTRRHQGGVFQSSE